MTYRMVGDEVVDVVAALPPSDGEAAAEVGDEHADDTDELELCEGNNTLGEEAVDDVDGDPESLGKHMVAQVNLQEPIDQSLAHRPADLTLSRHIVWIGHAILL